MAAVVPDVARVVCYMTPWAVLLVAASGAWDDTDSPEFNHMWSNLDQDDDGKATLLEVCDTFSASFF